jgi:membrane protease YdiL (CAAX protease family)
MSNSHQSDLANIKALLSQSKLTDNLPKRDIDTLAAHSEICEVKKGTAIVSEGEQNTDIFILIKGALTAVKATAGEDEKSSTPLAKVKPNDVFGIFALIDQLPRSASIVAATKATYLRIKFSMLQQHKKYADLISHCVGNLAREATTNLRESNNAIVKYYREKVAELKTRYSFGAFIYQLLILVGLYTITLNYITFFDRLTKGVAPSVIILFIFSIVAFLIMKFSHLKYADYGLTLKNWRVSLKESMFYSLLVLLFLLAMKAFLIYVVFPRAAPYGLITPTATFIVNNAKFSWKFYLIALLFYTASVPLQEFVTRGCLQSSFTHFFAGKTKMAGVWRSIFTSNLIFAMMHSHKSLLFVVVAFVSGLFWGWLYHRHQTLIGVVFSHILIGVVAVFVIGFQHLAFV